MGTMWLVCSAAEDAARLRREVAARDARARQVWFADAQGLLSLARLMPGVATGAALYLRAEIDEIEDVVRTLSREECVGEILVVVDELDAGVVARLLYAGAQEVIAAEESADAIDDANGARTGEGQGTSRPADDSRGDDFCDDERPPWDVHPAADGHGSVGGPPGCTGEQGEDGYGRDGALAPHGASSPAVPAASSVPARTCGPSADADAPDGKEETSRLPDVQAEGAAERPQARHEEDVRGTRQEDGGPVYAQAVAKPLAAAPHADGAARDGEPTVPPELSADDGAHGASDESAPVSVPSPVWTAGDGVHEMGGAPLIVAISGRGGCGKTTLVAALAWCSARMGLRTAVIDLDLMFGNLPGIMGVERPCDLTRLTADGKPACTPEAIEGTAMRIGPGLTLWGPCFAPEYAELLSRPVEQLIAVLRREADVIFVDTSVFWGDAVAAAVSQANRCLVVGGGCAASEASTVRAVGLAARIGVPKTRMTCVFNRFGAPGCDEERAMRFEMAVALRSRLRVADGGASVADLLSLGKLGDLMATSCPFTRDAYDAAAGMLHELGCPLGPWDEQMRAQTAQAGGKGRIKLPWHHEAGAPR